MSIEYIILITIMSIPVMLALFMLIAKIHFNYHNKFIHPILRIGFSLLNLATNTWTISILGLELPKELGVTPRLKRWKKREGKGPEWLKNWRESFANYICKILNNYDPGHC